MMRRTALLLAAGLAASALGTPNVRKVLIVGVDGCRPDALLAADTPTLDDLIAHGAFSTRCSAEDITISGPGWSSILTAVHRTKHGVVDNSFAGSNYAQYPHFFKRLQDACDASTASIVDWAPVNTMICQANADVALSGLPDSAVAAAAADLLAAAGPDVLFLHFDDCDHAGHAYGFSPAVPQYLAAIESTDANVATVLAAIHARPTFADEDWLVILTSDHGGTPDGAHGRNIPEHRLTPLIVSGLSSAAGSVITPDPQIVDVPATVMTFLGLPIDPAWGWDGVPVGLNMAASPSQPFLCVPPPPPPLGACCLPSGQCLQLTLPECTERRGAWQGLNSPCGACDIPTVLLAEDFNAVPLGPNADETIAGPAVWSPTPPAGWSIDRSSLPAGGVTEWRGWSIADRDWWSEVAGDQNRSLFTKASGAVAVADPDEWDDRAHNPGLFDSSITTRPIPLAGMRPNSARLLLDSSWRPEADQAASISARFDNGPAIPVAAWTSVPGPGFKPDAVNETLALDLPNPPGAQSFTLTFRLFDAGNNWWWALDNLQVVASPESPRRLLLAENFDAVPLGPNVDEALAGVHVWSGSPPPGWLFDDSGVPALNDPARGVTEWEGWAVADRLWWSQTAADQNRSLFTNASGAVAVADPDEWDDRGSPSTLGPYNARMASPAIPLAGVLPGSLILDLDSSWRPEALQQARLTAVFDTGARLTILQYDSAAGPAFKPDAPNEHLALPINNPPGAASVRLDFELLNARNNWWWAVDNLALTGAVAACTPDFNHDGFLDFFDYDDFVACFEAAACPPGASADFNQDGFADFFDYDDFVSAFESGC